MRTTRYDIQLARELGIEIRQDAIRHWKNYGKEILARVADESPEVYLSFIGKLLAQDTNEPASSLGTGNIVIQWQAPGQLPVIDAGEKIQPSINGEVLSIPVIPIEQGQSDTQT